MAKLIALPLAVMTALALVLAPTPPAQAAASTAPKLTRTVAGEVAEYTLANGLHVILLENHAAPVVSWEVIYKVGSRNEGPGATGSAHLLEHMLFKGTKTLGKGQIAQLLDRNGADSNASTWVDWTNYYETYAADRLELGLRVEASRMRDALILDSERQSEMTVVRNEMERGESSPGRILYQHLMSTAYRAHPYQHPTIGWRSDVEGVPTKTLKAFYDTYYQPNNATAVLVGDFKRDQAISLIRRYFEGIPAGPRPPAVITTEEPQLGERRTTLRRRGETNQVLWGYHIPAAGHADIAPLVVLDAVLSNGVTGRLYQALIETQLATSSYSDVGINRDPGLFTFAATLKPGTAHAKIEEVLTAQVDKVRTAEISPAELAKAKSQVDASYIYQSEGTSGLAHTLATYAAIDKWKRYFDLASQIKQVTANDVQRVAWTYLQQDNRTAAWYVATPDGPVPAAPKNAGSGKATANVAKPVPAPLFDFEQRKPAPRKAPAIVRRVLPSGLTLIMLPVSSSRSIAVDGFVRVGGLSDPQGKDGCAQAVASLLDAGTAKRDKLTLAGDLEGRSAGMGFGGGITTTSVDGHALAKDAEPLFAAIAEAMRTPTFPQDELDKLKSRWVASIQQGEDQPSTHASRALAQAIYPKDHPYYQNEAATDIATINGLTRADVVAFHKKHYGPNTTTLVVVGRFDPEPLMAMVEGQFAGWDRAEPGPSAIPDVPRNAAREVVVPMPDKTNVEIRFGHSGNVKRTSPGYYATALANYVLGGDPLTGRLGLRLRDELGLTYGTYAQFAASTGAGSWRASVTVNPANVGTARKELRSVIDKFLGKGVTAQELAFAKGAFLGSQAVGLASNGGMAGSLADLELYGLGLDYWSRYAAVLDKVTLADVNAAARRLIHPKDGHWVLVGPVKP